MNELAIWKNKAITAQGQRLLAKLQTGETLTITKALAGAGVVEVTELENQTYITNTKQNMQVESIDLSGDNADVKLLLTNVGLNEKYQLSQIGIYAQDPDEGEILYFIAQSVNPDIIPTETETPGYVFNPTVHIAFGNAETVDVQLNPFDFVTQGQMTTHKEVEVLDHPDGSVTDKKIGTRTIQNPENETGTTTGNLTELLNKDTEAIRNINKKTDKKKNEWIATTTGTNTAYEVTLDPAPEKLYKGMRITIIPHVKSDSVNATLNVNGLGAKQFRYRGFTSNILRTFKNYSFLSSGEPIDLIYSGAYWVCNYRDVQWSDITSKPSEFIPSAHATTSNTYGAGTETNYGHVRLFDTLTTDTAGQAALDAHQGKILDEKKADKDHEHETSDITGLATVATSGDYNDLENIIIKKNTFSYNGGTIEKSLNIGAPNNTYLQPNNTLSVGDYAKPLGEYSAAIGFGVETGEYSIGVGDQVRQSSESKYSISVGNYLELSGQHAGVFGYQSKAKNLNFVIGEYNAEPTPTQINASTGDLFIVGNGTYEARKNAFRVSADGYVRGTRSYSSTGADYAEFFEWQDGNENNEDRRGMFVTVEGEKIRIAEKDDYIIGVISANASVIGDNYSDEWMGMVMRDVYGEPIMIDATDENGNVIYKDDGTPHKKFKINPDYDPEQKYIPREERKEWACVGLIGKLIVNDDGTCEPNGYCVPSNTGIATAAKTGFRVLSRLDDTHIKILKL